jgi:predicted nucleic acid-binding protein
VARRKLSHEGTLVLDCEGLSKLVGDHEPTVAMVAEARGRGMEVVINALTIVEATHRRTGKTRLNWLLSGLRISPVGDKEAKAASDLLLNAGLHGHKYAIDAMLSATALAAPGPVTVLTSDPEDLAALCGARVTVIKV